MNTIVSKYFIEKYQSPIKFVQLLKANNPNLGLR